MDVIVQLNRSLARRYTVAAAIALTLSRPAFSQDAAPPAPDMRHGRALFESQCGRCHGIDGTGGTGANLRRPKLRRATDDSSLFQLIQGGIPERGMPEQWQLDDRELWSVVAYVRSLGRTAVAAVAGDAGRGRALFVGKGGCAACHIVAGVGGSLGPELTEVGAARGPAYLRRALVRPGDDLPTGPAASYPWGEYVRYLPVRIVTHGGQEIVGWRLAEDPFTIQIRDARNAVHSFDKRTLRVLEKQFGKSLMPSYVETLTPSELDDVVAYLSSLRGTP
jgi:cytochrome c oxidase cbb3-type subunit 3